MDSAHNTPISFAIAGHIDPAGPRGVVLGVNEMEVGAETPPFRISYGVCPAGDASEVVVCSIVQQALKIRSRVTRHEVTGDIRHRNVPESYVAVMF